MTQRIALPSRPDPLENLLLRLSGSYLRNAYPQQQGVCRTCSTPTDGYKFCWQCQENSSMAMEYGHRLADRVGFLTYAIKNEQAYQILHDYKLPRGKERFLPITRVWVAWLLRTHALCAQRLAQESEDIAWATVPSVRSGRTNEHPLHWVVAQTWGTNVREIKLIVRHGDHPNTRTYQPDLYKSEALHGEHVLLVDDLWVTGSNAQSAASALADAGASQVSTLVLGRQLTRGFTPTDTFMAASDLSAPFDIWRCPFTGAQCP